mgnify:CR=1 FL=1
MRNNKIIYINSNKKIQCKDNIDSLTKTNDYQWVICQFSYKGKFNFNNYKIHFFKMRKHLYDLSRNSKNFNELTYSGFVSPMFAIFDGYIIGDNKKYCFIDCGSDNSHPYKINYSKSNKKIKVSNKPSTDIVNVIFACSFDIKMTNIFFQLKVVTKYQKNIYKMFLILQKMFLIFVVMLKESIYLLLQSNL